MHYLTKHYKTILAAIALLILSIYFLIRAATNGFDVNIYLLAANYLSTGQNPYQASGYIYPMLLAFLVIPLTYVPEIFAHTIWFLINYSSIILSIYLCCLYIAKNCTRTSNCTFITLSTIFVIFLFLYSSLVRHLELGQVNCLVLLLMCIFLYYLDKKNTHVAAFLLALAISIKIIPGILVLFLLMRREFKCVIWTSLYSILLCMLPVILVGEQIFHYYLEYLNNFIIKDLASQTYVGKLQPLPFNISDVMHSISSLDITITRILSLIIGVGLLAYTTRLNHISVHPQKNILIFCCYLTIMLLLTPKLQKHYFVYFIPSIITIYYIYTQLPQYLTRTVKISIIAFIFCIIFKSIHQGYFYFFAMVSLLAALMLILHNMRKAKPLTQQTSN